MNLNVHLTCILLERQGIDFAIEKLVTIVHALTILFSSCETILLLNIPLFMYLDKTASRNHSWVPKPFIFQDCSPVCPFSSPTNPGLLNENKRRLTAGDLLRYWLACCWSKSSALDSVVVFVLMLGLVLTFSASSLPDIFP